MTLEIIPLFVTLLTLSLKAAVLVAAILIVRKLIGKRLSPAWRHGLWLLVPLQLLLFVSVPSSWSVQNLWTKNIEPVAEESVKNVATIPFSHFERGEPSEVSTAPHPPYFIDGAFPGERGTPNDIVGTSGFSVSLPSPIQIAIAVWFVGFVATALVFLRQTRLCRKWRREAELVESEAVLHLFKDCARQMKVRTWLVVAESRSVGGPLLIGAIRPMLLLPKGLVESATPQQLRTVFLHELAHLKRWDVWIGWLMTLLLTLHWFNPLLWLAVRKMNADREEAADELALRTLRPGERPDYGLALIDIAQHYITPARTPGLVGISETGKNLTRRIEMLNRTGTWKLRWKILALMAVFVLGVTTMTDAQTPKRSPAEIQVEIDRLQAELKEVETKEPTIEQLSKNVVIQRDFRVGVAQDSLQVDGKKMTLQELVRLLKDGKNETIKTIVLNVAPDLPLEVTANLIETLTSQGIENLQFTLKATESKIGDVPLTLTGVYLGTEGDDRFGIIIGEAKNGVYPVTMYEDGLPGKGYDPNDDDRYEGTAVFVKGKFEITLARKFDGMREEPVEDALKQLTANVVKEIERENRRVEVSNGSALSDGFVLSDGSVRNRIFETKKITLTIPKNREWDAVSVSREAKISRDEVRPAQEVRNNADLPGSYLGHEGDDRIGMVLGEAKDGPSGNTYPVTIYEDGLPGKGYDPNDDDRYEGTAIVTDGKLEITLLKKFDENVEEPVEKPLRKLTATLGSENGKMTLSIPKNREWDAVKLTKTP